jgi:acyl-CoA reductase-like NAD-dependent aldehyde dehydrogenase
MPSPIQSRKRADWLHFWIFLHLHWPAPGSVRAVRAVAEEAARVGKRVVLELGGSDLFIVLEDADLEKAVQIGVTSRYFNNSQGCICAKRFLVAESLFDDFTKAFVEQSKALPMDDHHDQRLEPTRDFISIGAGSLPAWNA